MKYRFLGIIESFGDLQTQRQPQIHKSNYEIYTIQKQIILVQKNTNALDNMINVRDVPLNDLCYGKGGVTRKSWIFNPLSYL